MLHSSPDRPTFAKYLPLLLLILLPLIIYSNTFNSTFHFDDTTFLNRLSEQGPAGVIASFRFSYSRYIGYFTLATNYAIHGTSVTGYHLVNLAIHILTSIVVWRLTLLTLSTPFFDQSLRKRQARTLAITTALIFAVHPLQTQAVTYIVQRFASLATLFYLSSLFAYLKARQTQNKPRTQASLFALSILLGVLGMYTKSIVFTLPFSILLYEILFLTQKPLKTRLRSWLALTIPFSIIIGTIALRMFNLAYVFSTKTSIIGLTVTQKDYLLTQFKVIPLYIRLLFIPLGQNIDHIIPLSHSLLDPITLIGFFIILSILALALVLARHHRLITFAILWFFITLSVESSFIPIEDVIFEHRLYLPMLGFSLLVAYLIFILFDRHIDQPYYVAAASLIVVLGFLTFQRNKVWQNEYTLWSDVVAKSPSNARAHDNLAAQLLRLGRTAEAENHIIKALQLNPDHISAHNNYGYILVNRGEYDLAIKHYQKAVALKPNNAELVNNLGVAYLRNGDYDLAQQAFQKSLDLNPNYSLAQKNLTQLQQLLQGPSPDPQTSLDTAINLPSALGL